MFITENGGYRLVHLCNDADMSSDTGSLYVYSVVSSCLKWIPWSFVVFHTISSLLLVEYLILSVVFFSDGVESPKCHNTPR